MFIIEMNERKTLSIQSKVQNHFFETLDLVSLYPFPKLFSPELHKCYFLYIHKQIHSKVQTLHCLMILLEILQLTTLLSVSTVDAYRFYTKLLFSIKSKVITVFPHIVPSLEQYFSSMEWNYFIGQIKLIPTTSFMNSKIVRLDGFKKH